MDATRKKMMQQALDVLEMAYPNIGDEIELADYDFGLGTLRQAIEEYEQAEKQDPVAWISKRKIELLKKGEANGVYPIPRPEHDIPLYTHPKPRLKKLTNEDIAELGRMCGNGAYRDRESLTFDILPMNKFRGFD